MAWVPFYTTTVSGREWRFSPAVAGDYFRIQHTFPDGFYGRGLIGQCSGSLPRELFGIKKLFPKEEFDVYEFQQPAFMVNRCIALRAYRLNKLPWTVSIEVWT